MSFYIKYTQHKSWRSILPGLGLLGLIFCLSGCKPADDTTSEQAPSPSSQNATTWTRTVETAKGPVILTQQPKRIVSTSITITGTLLAINAPVIASGATVPDTTVADNQGFFTQWSEVAQAKKLVPIYQTEPNAEAVAGMNPDLIIISATGGDSALKLYEQLSVIAPTLVINYDDKSWQELAVLLGQATGHEADAQQVIATFTHRLNEVKQNITLPPQPTSAFVYQAADSTANLWTENSAQGKLLQELGFTLAQVPDAVKGNTSMGHRKDIIQLGGEKLAEGLNGETILLFSGDQPAIDALKSNKFLAHTPAIEHNRVYAAGYDTFRLDYYSASKLLARLEEMFKAKS
ncbi:TPA: Fe2+-enterobactin ABC transporter substrate-binding protein [Yersinia enterocolitica]|nr:Fe2+-enterobactin ABC transporter substrate-binding protein [Yersinia enterocolitica]HDM8435708.1 Fe2+-enterobactin ABC transporter substrate-binding protein [Yersinia enterocolitica]HED4488433.1 Fe2+-enterobactin ABC transporter substrate-binding protein [Yersinia enterocolitica]HEM6614286.1 Fe2+-enterobactin ABC transporter substrate-binding protein [Yersinia enterocolitica]